MKKVKPQQKPHYYIIEINACALCGAEHITRQRVYGKKPKDLSKIRIYKQEMACWSHF